MLTFCSLLSTSLGAGVVCRPTDTGNGHTESKVSPKASVHKRRRGLRQRPGFRAGAAVALSERGR